MQGDLVIHQFLTPTAGVPTSGLINGSVFVMTNRLLTEEEKTKLLNKEEPEGDEPNMSGYNQLYMDLKGLMGPEAPTEAKFEPTC